MAPALTVSDATFTKLQLLAVPLVDTPESVIDRLADEALARRAVGGAGAPAAPSSELLRVDADRHDSLTHTKLITAIVDGKDLHRPKWNSLLDHIHVLGWQRLGSFDALKKATRANLKPGRYEKEGFHYLPEANLSIQGLDANLAWDHALGLARHLRIGMKVRFEWREKDGAAHPGRVAAMEWSPPTLAVA